MSLFLKDFTDAVRFCSKKFLPSTVIKLVNCTKFYDATAVLFLDAETNFLMQFVGIANQWQFTCLLSTFVQ